jgi:hypothetical protein
MKRLKMDKNILLCFKAITVFIDDLAEMFAPKHRPLKLYRRLLKHVKTSDSTQVKKHVEAFKKFCFTNKEAILAKSVSDITESVVKFSPRVYVNIVSVFGFASDDPQTTEAIWTHLLVILAHLDPESRVKDALVVASQRDSKSPAELQSSATDFLQSNMSKIGSLIEPNADPLSSITSILKSDVFADIITNITTKMQDGSLDIMSLIGAATSMAGSSDGEGPDLSALTSMLGAMSSGK